MTDETVTPPFVYVLVGFHSDKSGCKLLGIYDVLSAAQDREALLRATDCMYVVRVVRMSLNKASPQEVF